MDLKAMAVMANDIITRCEADLKRKLSDGEKRDLLMDNTSWTSRRVWDVVEVLKSQIEHKP